MRGQLGGSGTRAGVDKALQKLANLNDFRRRPVTGSEMLKSVAPVAPNSFVVLLPADDDIAALIQA